MARELVSSYGGRPDEEGREYKYLYCTSYNTTILWNDQGSFDVSYGKKAIGPDVFCIFLGSHLVFPVLICERATFKFLSPSLSERPPPGPAPAHCSYSITEIVLLIYHFVIIFFFFSCQLASLYVSV